MKTNSEDYVTCSVCQKQYKAVEHGKNGSAVQMPRKHSVKILKGYNGDCPEYLEITCPGSIVILSDLQTA